MGIDKVNMEGIEINDKKNRLLKDVMSTLFQLELKRMIRQRDYLRAKQQTKQVLLSSGKLITK